MKKTAKKGLSMFLSFLMVFTSFAVSFTGLSLTASARDSGASNMPTSPSNVGDYDCEIIADVRDGAELTGFYAYVGTVNNNGNGTTYTDWVFEDGNSAWSDNKKTHTYYGYGMDFPKSIRLWFDMKYLAGSLDITISLNVRKHGTDDPYTPVLIVCEDKDGPNPGSYGAGFDGRKDRNYRYGPAGCDHASGTIFYPDSIGKPTTISNIVGTPSINVPQTGVKTGTYTAQVYDQYGVPYYQAPDFSVVNVPADQMSFSGGTLSVKPAANRNKDYTVQVKATKGSASSRPLRVNIGSYHSATLDLDGGTGATSATVGYTGDTVTLPTPSKTGYTFTGWLLLGSGSIDNATNKLTYGSANTSLRAQYSPNTYTVSFNQDGAEVQGDTSKTVIFNENIDDVRIPTRTGYEFTGYYTGRNGTGTRYVDESGQGCHAWNFANNTTVLYPGWTGTNFKINYYKNDKTPNLTQESAQYTDSYTIKSAADLGYAYPGYRFTGWNTARDGSGMAYSEHQSIVFNAPAQAQGIAFDLYAQWELLDYTLTVNVDADTVFTGQPTYTGNVNTKTDVIPNPTKEGYTFDGWTASSGDLIQTSQGFKYKFAATDATLTPNFTPITYTVSVNRNGGTYAESSFSGIIRDEHILTTPTRTGSTFKCWRSEILGDLPVDPVTGNYKYTFTANNDVVKAIFDDIEYNLVADLDGGTGRTSYSGILGETVRLVAPTKTGYKFQGWGFVDGVGTLNTDNTFTFAAGLGRIKAFWTPVYYSVTIDPAPSTDAKFSFSPAPMGTDLDLSTHIPTDPTGYKFKGWTSSHGTINGNTYTVGTSDDTIKPVFEGTPWQLTLDLKGGTASVDHVTGVYGESVDLPIPTKPGYKFMGWSVNLGDVDNSTNKYTFALGNAQATAVWDLIGFYVNIDPGEGEWNYAPFDKKAPNTTVTVPDPTPKRGYEFTGWTVDGAPIVGNEVTLVDHDLYLKATYRKISHTITMIPDNGLDEYVLPVSPLTDDEVDLDYIEDSKTGYKFAGWSVVNDPTSSAGLYTLKVGGEPNIRVQANWVEKTYSVAYRANKASGTMDYQSVRYTQMYTIADCVYEKADCSFQSWNTKADGTGVTYYPGYKVISLRESGTFDLYAQWKVKDIRVDIDLDGGTWDNDLAFMGCDGDTLNFAKLPEKDGYIFAGWTASCGGTNDYYYVFGSKNATLKANWVSPDFTLTLDLGKATTTDDTTIVDKEGKSVVLDTPVIAGLDFAGWKLESGKGSVKGNTFTFGYGDATLTTTWTKDGKAVDQDGNLLNPDKTDDGGKDNDDSGNGAHGFIERLIKALRDFFKKIQDFFRKLFKVEK